MSPLLIAILLAAPSEITDPDRFCEDTCENPQVLEQRHQQLMDASSKCSAACEKQYPNPDKNVVFVTDQCMACIDKCNAKLAQDERVLADKVEACSQECRTKVVRHPECCTTVDGYTSCTETCLRTKVKVELKP
jgi:hypothetical protein